MIPQSDETRHSELESQLHALAALEKSVRMSDAQTARLRAAMQAEYRRRWYKKASRVAALLTLLGVAGMLVWQQEEKRFQYPAPAPMGQEYDSAPVPAGGCPEPPPDARMVWGEMECETEEMFDGLDGAPLLGTNGSVKIASVPVAQNVPSVQETGKAKYKAARKKQSPPQQLARLLAQPEPDIAAIRDLLEKQRPICIPTAAGDFTITLADDQSITITGSNAPAHTLRTAGDSLPEALRALLLSYLSTDSS